MTKTLVTDGFDERVPPKSHNYYGDPLVHDIVYGSRGWVDNLDRATIEALTEAGVIVLDRAVSGPGWHSNLYRSVQGEIPDKLPKELDW